MSKSNSPEMFQLPKGLDSITLGEVVNIDGAGFFRHTIDLKFKLKQDALKIFLQNNIQLKKPLSCFISYAWAKLDHSQFNEQCYAEIWVNDLASLLRCAGISVFYDGMLNKKDLYDSDFIIMIGTPRYLEQYYNIKQDLDSGDAESKYRASLVQETSQYFTKDQAKAGKKVPQLIPILLQGEPKSSFPELNLKENKLCIDFTQADYFRQIFQIIQVLYGLKNEDPVYRGAIQKFTSIMNDIDKTVTLGAQNAFEKFCVKQCCSFKDTSWNIPKKNSLFMGRKLLLEQLQVSVDKVCSRNYSITVLSGLGGVGKTELVLQYVHSLPLKKYDFAIKLGTDSLILKESFTAHAYTFIAWFSASSTLSLELSYVNFAQALNIKTDYANPVAVRAEVNQWLEQNPGWLIVFDDVETYESIEDYIPNQGKIILTTRNTSWPSSFNQLSVEQMNSKEALDLLIGTDAKQKAEMLSKYKIAELENIANALGSLPIALVIANQYLKENILILERQRFKLDVETKFILFNCHAVGHQNLATLYDKNLNTLFAKSKPNELAITMILLKYMAFLPTSKISKRELMDFLQKTLSARTDLVWNELTILEIFGNLNENSIIKNDEENCIINPIVQMVIRHHKLKKPLEKSVSKPNALVASSTTQLVNTASVKALPISSYLSKNVSKAEEEFFSEFLKNKLQSYCKQKNPKPTTCYIHCAYSQKRHEHDKPVHEIWIKNLTQKLQEAGIVVITDGWIDRHDIEACDFVIMVGTKLYLNQYQTHKEISIYSSPWLRYQRGLMQFLLQYCWTAPNKIISILLEGSSETSLPFVQNTNLYNFTQGNFLETVLKLILKINGVTSNDFTYQVFLQEYQKHVQSPKNIKSSFPHLNYWNIPRDDNFFFGREALLIEMHRQLTAPVLSANKQNDSKTNKESLKTLTPLVLHGLGGIGKTALAIQYTTTISFPDKHLVAWFNASSKNILVPHFIQLALEVNLIKDAVSIFDTAAVEKVTSLVKSWLEQNPGWLLIFDGAQSYEDITSFLPAHGGEIIITSRQACWPDSWYSLNVPEMNIKEAKDIFEHLSTKEKVSEKEKQNLDILINHLGGLPLALVKASDDIKHQHLSIGEYLKIYQKYPFQVLDSKISSTRLLSRSGPQILETWNKDLKAIANILGEQNFQIAMNILNACAHYELTKIPSILLTQWFDTTFKSDNTLFFHTCLNPLLNYSLLRFETAEYLIINPFLQTVFRLHAANSISTQDFSYPKVTELWLKTFKDAMKSSNPAVNIIRTQNTAPGGTSAIVADAPKKPVLMQMERCITNTPGPQDGTNTKKTLSDTYKL